MGPDGLVYLRDFNWRLGAQEENGQYRFLAGLARRLWTLFTPSTCVSIALAPLIPIRSRNFWPAFWLPQRLTHLDTKAR